MSPDEAAQCAEIIVDLFVSAMSNDGDHQLHLVEGKTTEPPPVPRFLIKS